jgi:pimeloyl-ACP methyl ester carboxylesterase
VSKITPIELAGARGGYVDTGERAGGPLVLLISPFSTAAVYRPTIDALARQFRVLAVEFPGSGQGSRLDQPWDLADHAAWTLQFLDALKLPPVTLVGHSHSAAVALHAAAANPARLRRMVLVNAVGAGGPRTVIETLAGCAFCLPMEIRFVTRSVPHLAANLLHHRPNFMTQLRVASRADVEVVARGVTTPTLLAWGRHDYVEPPRSLRRLASWIPTATSYISRRGSHDWLIERPEEFSEAVERFARSARYEIAEPS